MVVAVVVREVIEVVVVVIVVVVLVGRGTNREIMIKLGR